MARSAERSQEFWESLIPRIKDDVVYLHSTRHRFELLVEAARNPEIPEPNHVMEYVAGLYANTVLVGLRRQADKDDRTASLRVLLRDLRQHPKHATRDWYVAKYPAHLEDMANSTFDRFTTEVGDQYISRKEVEQDLARLGSVTKKLTHVVNNQIAHLNQAPEGGEATFADVSAALKAYEDLVQRYFLLVDGAALTDATPTLQFDFLRPLQVPWVER